MANTVKNEWTEEDVKAFSAFIRKNGGQVVSINGLWNGGYEFSIVPPKDAIPNWAFFQMKDFMDKR